MELREAVEECIKRHGGSQIEAARALGVSNSHLSNMKSGNCKMPTKETLDRLGIKYEDGRFRAKIGDPRKIPPGWGFRP